MRILLVNTNRVTPPIAPLALDYIGAAARDAGHAVALLDLCWERDAGAAVARTFAAQRIDLAAVTFRNTDDCYFASRFSFVPVLERDVALIREYFDGPVVLGGCGFSLLPVPLLERVGLGYGVRGDGDAALPALARALEGEIPLARVPGLIYRRDGEWKENAPAWSNAFSPELSARDLVDNRRYFARGGQAGIETKRGCPCSCIYCADPVTRGHRSRARPAAHVVHEVGNLLAQGIDHLHLCDSEFNLPVQHAAEVCHTLVAAGLGDKVRWYTYASPAPFSPELAALMRQAGCVGINFGVDNGSDRMLAGLGRNFTARDIRAAARACRAAGITVMFDLLLGAPGETWETVAETIELMRSVEPDRVGISFGVRVYPGTPLAVRLLRAGNEERGLSGSPSGLDPVFYLSPQLGDGAAERVREMVRGDERFFLPSGGDERDYNYNDNAVLQHAIDAGARGAYWDILRRIESGA